MIKLKDILLEKDYGKVLFGDIPNGFDPDFSFSQYGLPDNDISMREFINQVMKLQNKDFDADRETNTKEEDELFRYLMMWSAHPDEARASMIKLLPDIKAVADKYPMILRPGAKIGTPCYRGLQKGLMFKNPAIIIKAFKKYVVGDEVDFDKIPKTNSGTAFLIEDVKYIPRSPMQSWTVDKETSYLFGTEILQSTVDKDYYFNQRFFNLLWSGEDDLGEDEILHFGVDYKSPVNLIIVDIPYNRRKINTLLKEGKPIYTR